MTQQNPITPLLESRLGRYVVADSAFAVAAVPSQAAPVTVLLPTPVNVTQGYTMNLDGNFLNDVFFSGVIGNTNAFLAYVAWGQLVGSVGTSSPGVVSLLSAGTSVVLAHTDPIWRDSDTAAVPSITSPDYFIGIRFASNTEPCAVSNASRIGFAQLNGPLLYGWAWDEAPSITVFNLRNSASGGDPIPEPATGALAALALGAVALAARKRKQS
jgi:hypothetical protein